jgi:hypothetical protein
VSDSWPARLRRRPALALGALAFAVSYLYTFPYFGALKNANELPRILMTQEIVERGTFAIDARLGEMGSTFDVATAPDGRHFPNKAPGLSLLAVPVYALARAVAPGAATDLRVCTWLFRVTLVTVPALLFLGLFFVMARRFTPDEEGGGASAALCAYGLGSMLFPYALLFMSHAPAAAAVGAAFATAVKLVRGEARRPASCAVAVGVLGGVAVLCDYEAALGVALVCAYAVAFTDRRRRTAAAILLGSAPFAAALLAFQWRCFGSPWRTGYSFSPHVAHREGWLGLVGPNRHSLWIALVAPDSGLLVLSPWVLLSVVGVVAIVRSASARARVGREAMVAAAVAVGYVLLVGSMEPSIARAGWAVGPRYLAVAMPFLGWLAAPGLTAVGERPIGRVAAHALVLVGVIVHVLAATTYPQWPDTLANPVHEIAVRALREGLAPHSLGTLLGLRGLASLVPLYLVVGALCLALLGGRPARHWWPTVVAAAVAAAIVFPLYGRLPRSGAEADGMWRFVRSTWEPVR